MFEVEDQRNWSNASCKATGGAGMVRQFVETVEWAPVNWMGPRSPVSERPHPVTTIRELSPHDRSPRTGRAGT